MKKNFYLDLLILFSIWTQEISTFSENKKLSEPHVRRKRIIDRTSNGNRQISLRKFPYIVNILEDGECDCAGSILSPIIIITAAHCVYENGFTSSIFSNSPSRDRGTLHNVTRKILHPLFDRQRVINDLALLVIYPAINFQTSRNEPIKLYSGHLPRNPMGTTCGWGYNYRRGQRVGFPHQLRSITIPILSLWQCQNAYRGIFHITDQYICTYYRNKEKCCDDGDSGGPLVVNDRLVGVYSFCGKNVLVPDVFMNLMHPPYQDWILSYVPHAF